MKYVMLIHQGTTPVPPSDEWNALSEAEQQQIAHDYQAINETPGVTPGLGLQPPDTATTVRVRDGEVLVTDGPYAETKEALGGWYVFEADDLDAAIEMAAKVPAARMGGGVEVRAVREW